MEKEHREIWFPSKLFGWGWGLPITWQGWVVLVIYVASIITLTRYHRPASDIETWLLYFVPITIVFLAICWFKGERLAWHWGRK